MSSSSSSSCQFEVARLAAAAMPALRLLLLPTAVQVSQLTTDELLINASDTIQVAAAESFAVTAVALRSR